jgi:hypothetical protein
MQTNNGAQGQSRFNGLQMTSNGTHGHPSFIRQQINQFDGAAQQTPIQINYSPAVSIPHGTYTPQGHVQGQLGMTGQQFVNMNDMTYNMPIRNVPTAPTFLEPGHTQGNTQHNQHAHLQAQHRFASQPLFNAHGWNPMMANETNPNAMAALSQPYMAFSSGQIQNPEANCNGQSFQNPATMNNPTDYAVYENSFGSNTPNVHSAHPHIDYSNQFINQSMPSAGYPDPVAVRQQTCVEHTPQTTSPAETISTGNVVAAEQAKPAECTEISKEFQENVNQLLEEKGGKFRGHIRNKADVARYENAVKAAKGKSSKVEDKSVGYPANDSGRLEIIHRISDAFFKLDGEQDHVSDSADNVNCYALKAIRETSLIEVEILADKLMVSLTT